MELTDLSHEERLALVGMLRWVATADGIVTQSERGVLHATGTAFGEEAWKALGGEASRVFKNAGQLKEFCARQVTRPEARQLIYRHLARMASADGWDATEVRLLNEIGVGWGLIDSADIVGADEEFDLDDYDDADELDTEHE